MPPTEQREAISLTPGQFYVVGALLGTVIALGFAFGTLGYYKLKHTQDQLRQITNPTPREYRAQLKRGIRLCLHEPECRKLFPKLTSSGHKKKTQQRRTTQQRR